MAKTTKPDKAYTTLKETIAMDLRRKLLMKHYRPIMKAFGIDEAKFRETGGIEYFWWVVDSARNAYGQMKHDYKEGYIYDQEEFDDAVDFVVSTACKRLRKVADKPRLAGKKANGALFGYLYNGIDYGLSY